MFNFFLCNTIWKITQVLPLNIAASSLLGPQYQPQSLAPTGAQWILVELSLIWTNIHKVTTIYFHSLDNALSANAISRGIFWAEENVFKLAHQHLKNELRGSVLVGLQKHIDFIHFELRISLGTWEEAEMWACWFLRDPASQQLLYLNTRAFFPVFLGNPWQCAASMSYQLPGVGRPPGHFKQGAGDAPPSNGAQDEPAGLGAFRLQSPDYFHGTWASHCCPWFFFFIDP